MTALGIEYVDLHVDQSQKAPLRFTFKWPVDNQWQGSDFVVQVMHTADAKDDSALKRSAGS